MTAGDNINWRSPASWAIVGCFVIEATFNGIGGFKFLPGGGAEAWAIAGGAVLIAFLGAYYGREGAMMWKRGDRDGAWPLLAVAVGCFLFSQFTGMRAVGIKLSDGALTRDVAASDVINMRAELDRIGITRTVKEIQSDLSLELRRTSKTFPKGDGPAATKLEGELAKALRKIQLEDKLAAAGQSGGIVKAGAENFVMSHLGLTTEKNQLIAVVGLVLLVGVLGNFGFAMVEMAKRSSNPAGRPFDPMMLPEPMRPPMMPLLGGPEGPRTYQGRPVVGGGPGGGSTNIIYAGGNGQAERLPPRIAARRNN